MTVREVLIYPHPKLREKASPVVDFNAGLRTLIADMVETMYCSDGLGLAAPQIGVSLRVFVMHLDAEAGGLRVFINPKITAFSEEKIQVQEGCLSFPGYFELVTRSSTVTGVKQDVNGNEVEFTYEGLGAQCVQHEIEHLDGHVLVDNLSRIRRRLITKGLQKLKKKRQAGAQPSR